MTREELRERCEELARDMGREGVKPWFVEIVRGAWRVSWRAESAALHGLDAARGTASPATASRLVDILRELGRICAEDAARERRARR